MSLAAILRERRTALMRDIDAIVNTAHVAGRDLNVDEARRFRGLRSDVEALDARLSAVEADEARTAQANAAFAAIESRAHVGHEPTTYGPTGDPARPGFFRDVFAATRGDYDAAQRLQRHQREVAVEAESRVRQGRPEFRDLTRTDGAGGGFVPPLHLVDQYVELARAARPTADAVTSLPLPRGTDTLNTPKVSTGTATAIQTADNAAVQETDLTDTTLSAPVRTIAGQQDVAIQVLDQSPIAFDEVIFNDLAADYATKVNVQVLNGTGAAGQATGILQVAGINAVTYTDATPTVAEAYPKIADAVQRIAALRFLPGDAIVMHPRRWGWFLAALDGQSRPLVTPDAHSPSNAVGVADGAPSQGRVGTLMGCTVIADPSIPTNLGAGTNEDLILAMRSSDVVLYESPIRFRTLPDVGSGTLTVRLQVFGYIAVEARRYPSAISTVGGTGLITPAF